MSKKKHKAITQKIAQGDSAEVHKLTLWLERIGFDRYLKYTQSPARLIANHFIGGLAYGFGFVIGSTILISLFFLVFNKAGGLPLIGNWVSRLIEIIQDNQSFH